MQPPSTWHCIARLSRCQCGPPKRQRSRGSAWLALIQRRKNASHPSLFLFYRRPFVLPLVSLKFRVTSAVNRSDMDGCRCRCGCRIPTDPTGVVPFATQSLHQIVAGFSEAGGCFSWIKTTVNTFSTLYFNGGNHVFEWIDRVRHIWCCLLPMHWSMSMLSNCNGSWIESAFAVCLFSYIWPCRRRTGCVNLLPMIGCLDLFTERCMPCIVRSINGG